MLRCLVVAIALALSACAPSNAIGSRQHDGAARVECDGACSARQADVTRCRDVAFLLGRPMTDYDGLVRDWQKAAGDTVRQEYLEAMAAAS